MRLCARVMGRVRAPAMALALAGCGAEGATSLASVGQGPELAPAATMDPVAYDVAEEAERLARLDALAHGEEARRERRVALAEPDFGQIGLGIGSIGIGHRVNPGCGRG